MIDSQIVDQLLIREPLAQGSYGQCFRTEHVSSGRIYSLRILGNEFTRHDLESADILTEIDQEEERCSFPSVSYMGVWNNCPYIATPYAFGEDLSNWVRRKGPMDISQGIICIVKTLDCFMSMATDSVGHGLLRPSKLVLSRSGRIRVRDLPLARLFQRRMPLAWQSPVKIPIRQAECMAPEILMNGAQPGSRTDIYSLGCILYFLLVGKSLFRSSDTGGLLRALADSSVPTLGKSRSNIPIELEACFRKMVAINPADRFVSYQHCHATLKAIVVAMNRNVESIEHPRSYNGTGQAPIKRRQAKEVEVPKTSNWKKSKWVWISFVGILAVAMFLALYYFASKDKIDQSRAIQTVGAEESFQIP